MARGQNRDVDFKIESCGGFVTAKTTREAVQFSITVPKEHLGLALSTIFDILTPPAPSPERIRTEASIIREEGAIAEPSRFWSDAAWRMYGALDPGGDFDTIVGATREALLDTYKRQFSAESLVLAIAGDLSVDDVTAAAVKVLAVMPKREFKPVASVAPTNFAPTRGVGFGVAYTVQVHSYDTVQTAHALAAALSIGISVSNGFVFYTPSATRSLVTVGTITDAPALRKVIEHPNTAALFGRSKIAAKNWVNAQLVSGAHIAEFRGMLLCLRNDLRPEMLVDAVNAMTFDEFSRAVTKFQIPTSEVTP